MTPTVVRNLERKQVGLIVAAHNIERPSTKMRVVEFDPAEADPDFWSAVYYHLWLKIASSLSPDRYPSERDSIQVGDYTFLRPELRKTVWDFTVILLRHHALGDAIKDKSVYSPFVGASGLEEMPLPNTIGEVNAALQHLYICCVKDFN